MKRFHASVLTVIALLLATSAASAQWPWSGGKIKNEMTGDPNKKVIAEGDLAGGGKGAKEVPPGKTSKDVGVKDADLLIGVHRYGEGAKDFKFYTARIRNGQTGVVRDKKPDEEPSGWGECVDGNDMSDEDFAKAKAKYWDNAMARDPMTAQRVPAPLTAGPSLAAAARAAVGPTSIHSF